jgi:hypothetical protein
MKKRVFKARMKHCPVSSPNETIFEMKHTFITALAMLQECHSDSHTFVISEEPDCPRPVVMLINGVIEYGAALVDAMGKDAFYLWLDRFLHATYQEKSAMWENGGQWHD